MQAKYIARSASLPIGLKISYKLLSIYSRNLTTTFSSFNVDIRNDKYTYRLVVCCFVNLYNAKLQLQLQL